ncbi:dethiobiotin synthase [Deminuibacter soli]|uniref:ATP-dependent dethiobiotin synthetase BioD n=1 Tax=Deminuibacter soli TaxID=2291815 RepID=A0A3E1NJH6_9BACT|nr:dethiobiotin synthase [Deminuibacter soli]RFM28079.1 dethiobiotin synthase [Deminuibacter soli]
MNRPIFITGIGTEIGKTVTAAIVTEALGAHYWKPVQTGYAQGADKDKVKHLLSNTQSLIHPETYSLRLPASPHVAAREEGITISLNAIENDYRKIRAKCNATGYLVIEGAGGIMVPLNGQEFMADMITRLNACVILVSRNYLGSINHSLLTAELCKQKQLTVAGWIFNDQYLAYEEEIAAWSGYTHIASIPRLPAITKAGIHAEAERIKPRLLNLLRQLND